MERESSFVDTLFKEASGTLLTAAVAATEPALKVGEGLLSDEGSVTSAKRYLLGRFFSQKIQRPPRRFA